MSEEIKNEEVKEEEVVEATEEAVETAEEKVETAKEADETTPEKSELELANERAEDFENKYLRAHAEMQNIQRRANEERQLLQRYRSQDLAKAILPSLDNLERALAVGRRLDGAVERAGRAVPRPPLRQLAAHRHARVGIPQRTHPGDARVVDSRVPVLHQTSFLLAANSESA